MSFSPYKNYNASGFEWLGEIPSHWDVRRLKRILSEPLTYGANEASDDDTPHNPRYVRITDIGKNGELREDTFRSLPATIAEPYLLHDGDILLARSGATVGKSFIYRTSWGVCCYAGYLIRARVEKDAMLADYLYACCQSTFYWQYIASEQIQATIQNVSAERYGEFVLPCPPTQEQYAICAFLDREAAKIDALVEEQQRLIELLKEKRQAVISHAVTKGLDPNAAIKDSGVEWLGEVPEHWSINKLIRLTTTIGDGLHGTPQYVDQSEYHFINGNNLVDGVISIDDSTRCIDQEVARTQAVPLNDQTILMSINGTIGNLALYMGETVMLGKSAAYLNCTDEIDRSFLYYFLQSTAAKTHFRLELTGTTISNLSLATLRNAPIALPPLDEQRAIAGWIQDASLQLNAMIGEAEKSISLLKERRSALISAAVTGKVDVRAHLLAEAEAA